MTADWHDAWVVALDALEADVVVVEAMIVDDHRARELPPADPWAPPAGIGPLPLDLRPPADEIQARQVVAAQTVAVALASNRRQAEAASRIEAGSKSDPRRPSFIDCAA
jgi:hypothetical protein